MSLHSLMHCFLLKTPWIQNIFWMNWTNDWDKNKIVLNIEYVIQANDYWVRKKQRICTVRVSKLFHVNIFFCMFPISATCSRDGCWMLENCLVRSVYTYVWLENTIRQRRPKKNGYWITMSWYVIWILFTKNQE